MPRMKARMERSGKPAALKRAGNAGEAEAANGGRETGKKAPRGMKLKTVSMITLAFALACLGAFMAGRPPISEAETNPALDQTTAKAKPMFLGLRMSGYHVKDIGKAKEWYTRVLGIQPYFDQAFYVGYNVGGYELGLVTDGKAGEKQPPSTVAYWGVEDARASYQRLIDLGATPLDPVQDVGGGILAGAVYDPFGNVLGVIQNPYFKLASTN
jgi:predicted enzyme related to lactoylglutathione lyase